MASPVRTIITAILLVSVTLAGIAIGDSLAGVDDNEGAVVRQSSTVLLNGNEFVDVTSEVGSGTNETVRDSRGRAIQFTGANDSHLQSQSSMNLSSGENWTVHVGVWVNESAIDQTMMVVALGDPDVILRYVNESGSSNFSVVYMTSSESFIANVTEPDPTNASQIFINKSVDTVTIRRNDTVGESVDVNGSDTFTGDITSDENFHGQMDELRVFASDISDSDKSSLRSDPVTPLKGTSRTARLMFDEDDPTEVNIYWATTDADVSNVSYTTGFSGHVLTEDTLLTSNDYDWRENGPRIKPSAGGRLDGAPVAFADYDFSNNMASIMDGLSSMVGLVELLLVVIMAVVLIAVVSRAMA